jgi:hypothetical protein
VESKATMTTIAAYSLDELVKKFTIYAHRVHVGRHRLDRIAQGDQPRVIEDITSEYLDIFLQAILSVC